MDEIFRWKLTLSTSFSKINFSKCSCQAPIIEKVRSSFPLSSELIIFEHMLVMPISSCNSWSCLLTAWVLWLTILKWKSKYSQMSVCVFYRDTLQLTDLIDSLDDSPSFTRNSMSKSQNRPVSRVHNGSTRSHLGTRSPYQGPTPELFSMEIGSDMEANQQESRMLEEVFFVVWEHQVSDKWSQFSKNFYFHFMLIVLYFFEKL